MQEQNSNIISDDWRSDISSGIKAILKVQDGEEVNFKFLNEGTKKTHPDYGSSIVFTISHGNEEKYWYVNSENYDLLTQIKSLGILAGLDVRLSRKGSKKSDTRYTINRL